MIRSQKTLFIETSPQEVWDFLTDFPSYPRWVTDVVEVKVASLPIGRGTHLNIVRQYGNRRVDGLEEITEWEPLKRLRLQTPSGSFRADAVYQLEQEQGGTQVQYFVQIAGRGFGKILEWFIGGNFQKLVDSEFSRMKTMLETSHATL